jgi:hypothetical protein
MALSKRAQMMSSSAQCVAAVAFCPMMMMMMVKKSHARPPTAQSGEMQAECPLWVTSGSFRISHPCLIPRKQTCFGMTADVRPETTTPWLASIANCAAHRER